jgi:hypothetical protein
MSARQVAVWFLVAVSVPYLVLHHILPRLSRGVAGVTRASVDVVLADYNENCWAACRARALRCDSDLFGLINDCESMRAIVGGVGAEQCAPSTGFDLPAYDRYYKRVHVSTWPTAHPPSCGGRHPNTRRACVCRRADDADGDSSLADERGVHVVYSAEDSEYMEWQARFDYFWFEKVGWKNAKLTRLLAAAAAPKELAVPTHVAPPYNWSSDVYKAYNKPLSIMDWFARAPPIAEDVVVVVDPDCMFLKPFAMQELVREGKPVAMKALFSFDYHFRDRHIVERYSLLGNFTCTKPDPVAVPVLIHRKDLERLAPLWLKWTELIRADTEDGLLKWDPEWKKVSFSWTAEMFGYVMAACELGLRHDMWADLQAIPGQNATDLRTHPIIHYHTPVWAAGHKWVKYPKDAHTNFIWPLDKVWHGASTPLVDKTFFNGMYEAARALYGKPDDDFVWQGSLADSMRQIVRRNVKHRGCFRAASRADTDAYLINSVSHGLLPCAESCTNRNKTYSALSRGHRCYCASRVEAASRVADADAATHCDARCRDGELCGGADSDAYLDVYEVVVAKPFTTDQLEFVGCFPDNTGSRDLPLLKRLSVPSPGECVRLCVDVDHPYAGVQMGQECHCGKEPPGRVGPAFQGSEVEVECKFKCAATGDSCGGWSRNSVWKVKPGVEV